MIILKLEKINKSFPGVKALSDVSLEIEKGEVHAIVGENGAGKSTLMKIIAGIIPNDSGEIYLEGKKIENLNPTIANKLGIVMIHQELMLYPNLSVAENIFIEHDSNNSYLKTINFESIFKEAEKILELLGGDISPRIKVSRLSIGEQQKVEIAKAISKKAKIIIMDEPTSALTITEISKLFDVIRSLKKQGITILYISHRLDEVFEISDKITVLRDGHKIATLETNKTSPSYVVQLITGKTFDTLYTSFHETLSKEEIMRVENLNISSAFVKVKNLCFNLYKGEILGITGLLGAGKTEIARVLWGIEKKDSGEIWIENKRVEIKSPYDALNLGIGLVPENRRQQGLIGQMNVAQNITLPSLSQICWWNFIIDSKKEIEVAKKWIEQLKIITPTLKQKVENLSGGNQQKVVLAKWLATNPKILIVDEPTRGIDVGAKAEIRKLLLELSQKGISILLFSSEIEEVLNLANRILILYKGEPKGILPKNKATRENILYLAMGLEKEAKV
ncbi:MAG: D-xylose ABC transporter ATP-binding protein [Dictyoglomus sp. NZ13-RE01]|nr:MAG: D-xylose ABC transporter ATP-binding protein [Dictyoglomus sp. NZ13-RE01]